MSDQRQLFTQAANPNAPAGSPYGAPPAPGLYAPPGGGSGGYLGAGQQGTPYQTPMTTPGAAQLPGQPGYGSSPPAGYPQQPSFGMPNQPSPPPNAAHFAQPAAPQPMYPPEKAAYQPGWQDQKDHAPIPVHEAPAGSTGAYPQPDGAMAYHQLQQPVAPGPMPPQSPPAGGAVMQQPGATAPMNPAAGGPQYDAKGERDWKHGLFDCFADFGTCCIACWVPCMIYGKNKTRLDHINRTGGVHPTGGEMCGSDCLVHGLLTGCLAAGWVLQIGSRQAVRGRYRIRGDGCSDCCAAFCCMPCELTQEHLEIQDEERTLMGAPQPKF